METLFNEVSPWVTAALLAVAMLAGWGLSYWRGQSLENTAGDLPASKFNEAIMALLGLLMAFTFSMSLVKHEQRRQMTVADSNAIGDFYTCASLLDKPIRGRLQAEVRAYVEHRLSIARPSMDETTLSAELDKADERHRRIQSLVEEAVDSKSPVTIPLVNNFNAMTSSTATRLAAARDRLPPSIVLLLSLTAVVSMALSGRQQGVSREWRPGATVGFTLLVCMVIWVTLDLNQPRRGWITVSQEPMQRLLKSMGP